MSLFGNVTTEGMEQTEDRLGGGFQPLETGIYPAKVKIAYLTEADSGAKAVNLEFELEDGKTHRETIYVTSGTTKGGNAYFEKDGKKYPLPGFEQVNNICILTTETPLFEQAHEMKTLKLWDSESQAEIPREVPVFVNLIGEELYLAIQQIRENKTKKNESTGKWDPINEERVINEIKSSFHHSTKQTVSEAMGGRDAAFYDAWLEKNDGKTWDKYKEVAASGSSRSSSSRASAPTGNAGGKGSMFGKK